MKLKKTIAGYFDENKNWVQMREIEMHPLEEEAMRKHWAIHDLNIQIPQKMSMAEEHDLMIEKGSDSVKEARNNFQNEIGKMKVMLDAAEKDYQDAHNRWNNHVELCMANKIDPDTYPGDASLTLNLEVNN